MPFWIFLQRRTCDHFARIDAEFLSCWEKNAMTNKNMDAHCLPRCQCLTLRRTQCTRAASIHNGVAQAFCHAHRACGGNRRMSRKHSAQRRLAKVARGKTTRRETSQRRKAKVALTHLAEQTLRDLSGLRNAPKSSPSPVHKTPSRAQPAKLKARTTPGRALISRQFPQPVRSVK